MATMTFGQLDSWDSDSGTAKRASKDDYFNIRKDGQYNVRFVDKPYKFLAHWIEPIMGGKKLKINCAVRDCKVCNGGMIGGVQIEANKPKNYYVSFIKNCDANRFQVFEYTRQIFEAVKQMNANKKWGDPAAYDVEIDRNVNRKPEVYKCIPQPKEPLTKEDLAALEEFKARIDLTKYTMPMDNDAIERRIAEFVSRSSLPGTAPVAVVAAAATTNTESDPDFDFN